MLPSRMSIVLAESYNYILSSRVKFTCFLLDEFDCLQIAGGNNIDPAALDGIDVSLLDGVELRVGILRLEGVAVFRTDDDDVRVGFEEELAAYVPIGDGLANVAATRQLDDFVDMGSFRRGEVAGIAEPDYVVNAFLVALQSGFVLFELRNTVAPTSRLLFRAFLALRDLPDDLNHVGHALDVRLLLDGDHGDVHLFDGLHIFLRDHGSDEQDVGMLFQQ